MRKSEITTTPEGDTVIERNEADITMGSPKQVSWPLICSVASSVLGSLQIGYHIGNMNAPQKVIEDFFNETWAFRYEKPVPLPILSVLWSLTVSILALGATAAVLSVSLFADNLGRRNSILLTNMLAILSVLLMGFSKMAGSPEMLIIGRLVIGLYSGLSMALIPLYIQEVSPTALRGAFSTMNQLFYTIGIFLGQVMSLEEMLGTPKHWPLMLSLSVVPAVIQYTSLPFCPESPRYLLINKNQEYRALRALWDLRGTTDVVAEFQEMKEEMLHLHKASKVTCCQLFSVPQYRQPIIIALVLAASTQLSGFNAVINFSTEMFTSARIKKPEYFTLGVGMVNIMFTALSVLLVEKVGRRTLLLVGQMAMVICTLLLTVTTSQYTEGRWVSCLLVMSIFSFVAFYELGPGPITWFITAELFSQSARPVAMGVSGCCNWICKFLVAMIYQPLTDLIGSYCFLVFAACLFCAFIYTWRNVPETRGRTFEDITLEFSQTEVRQPGRFYNTPDPLYYGTYENGSL
ncbi:solute carrier family 2, facilitated glucose transporter member 1-like isoform X2 [Protopterus annectens]|uniref:solute carrier family 2, facilitated glucose transporter member 1-like isoform X2 n=1 Tax=Protopterus annectens TaxID=7888 RepID=UPI001CF9F654|nr:solute carrier family 2, facilitated glucose transporter member 1-like isoform X2 [Protopterus annectens]